MTCEILLMNRQAVALAADSATTVTQWVRGEKEERYFKGTNKIFQLSDYHPVGMMIYGGANLHRVPWDVIVKDFRREQGSKSFNDLAGYAQEFFEFIKQHKHLYPSHYQETIFIEETEKIAIIEIARVLRQSKALVKAKDDVDKRRIVFDRHFSEAVSLLEKNELPSIFPKDALEKISVHLREGVEESISRTLDNWNLSDVVNKTQIANFAINKIFKKYGECLGSTGVVITGFGDHDYFPNYTHYDVFGIILDNFLFVEKSGNKIDLTTKPSMIQPFATTAMINTFLMGFSPDVLGKVQDSVKKTLQSFAETLKQAAGLEQDIPDLEKHISDALEANTKAWADASLDDHYDPLTRIIGALPFDEMAELAETLIMLESLKEKVTRPTESVGGPIDVAVISKGDGFIWIKRKHYFDPALNTRFMTKQALTFK